MGTITLSRPSYVMNADGQPEAVLIDIATWQLILERLQDIADNQILSEVLADLKILASGNRPAGWKSWEEFEAELEAIEVAGEISD
ncbi:MAG: hypothetical protein HYR94_12580 [Chloroflexi bacterium]|nr:hypothetical protein [Chloroflexota bacterium]